MSYAVGIPPMATSEETFPLQSGAVPQIYDIDGTELTAGGAPVAVAGTHVHADGTGAVVIGDNTYQPPPPSSTASTHAYQVVGTTIRLKKHQYLQAKLRYTLTNQVLL